MNRPFRVSIAGVMGFVGVTSVGAMGLREGTALWASLTFGMTVLFLLGASLNALLQPADARAGWVGFALFGWVAMAISFGPWTGLPPTLTRLAADQLLARLHPEPEYERPPELPDNLPSIPGMAASPLKLKPGSIIWTGDIAHFHQTLHALVNLLCALIGSAWASALSRNIARTRVANSQNST